VNEKDPLSRTSPTSSSLPPETIVEYWMKREGGATPQSLPGQQTVRSPEGSDERKRSYRLFWMIVDLANRAQQFIL
jgi:hypothetical protein